MTRQDYIVEKKFKEFFRLMARTDLFVTETPGGAFVISVPDPIDDLEYILSAYRKGPVAKEYADLGRCVRAALDMGAASIHFRLREAPHGSTSQ